LMSLQTIRIPDEGDGGVGWIYVCGRQPCGR